MAKKWPEKVVQRSFIKELSFPISLYHAKYNFEPCYKKVGLTSFLSSGFTTVNIVKLPDECLFHKSLPKLFRDQAKIGHILNKQNVSKNKILQ